MYVCMYVCVCMYVYMIGNMYVYVRVGVVTRSCISTILCSNCVSRRSACVKMRSNNCILTAGHI